MASAVADVAAARRDYLDESGGRYVHVIADGSIGKSGDVAKAIACGADAVMVGSPFARATDAPGRGLHWGSEAHHRELPRGERVRFAPLEPGGYFEISDGNSYVQAVTWDDGAASMSTSLPQSDTVISIEPVSAPVGRSSISIFEKRFSSSSHRS